MSDDAFQRPKTARVESFKMLQILCFVERSVQVGDVTKEYTHFAFSWPRWSSVSASNVNKVSDVLNYECNFDGCAYGLQDRRGWALRKPHK
eukprot:2695012-Heterocapsa_arctica.AAC.1